MWVTALYKPSASLMNSNAKAPAMLSSQKNTMRAKLFPSTVCATRARRATYSTVAGSSTPNEAASRALATRARYNTGRGVMGRASGSMGDGGKGWGRLFQAVRHGLRHEVRIGQLFQGVVEGVEQRGKVHQAHGRESKAAVQQLAASEEVAGLILVAVRGGVGSGDGVEHGLDVAAQGR